MQRDGGKHAVACAKGGGVMKRHDAAKRTITKRLTKQGIDTNNAQNIPKGRTAARDATRDIVYNGPDGREMCVDVSCVDGSENSGASPAAFAIPRRERANTPAIPWGTTVPFCSGLSRQVGQGSQHMVAART